MQIEFDNMIKKANIVLRNKMLPNHDAFTISEVIGAVTGVSKEVVLDEMMSKRTEMDAAIAEHRALKE